MDSGDMCIVSGGNHPDLMRLPCACVLAGAEDFHIRALSRPSYLLVVSAFVVVFEAAPRSADVLQAMVVQTGSY